MTTSKPVAPLLVLIELIVVGMVADAHSAPLLFSKQPHLQLPGADTMTVM